MTRRARAPDRGATGSGKQAILLALLAAVVVVAAQAPVLSSQAVSFDDGQFVLDNPLVQNPSWESTARFFREILQPSTVQGYYLPLSMTSLMLDVAAGGRPGHLAPFHRTSLMLHACNTALVVLLLFLLFGKPAPAAIAGILFGLHPLTVEAVAWVGERKTLLASFFAIGSLILYVRHAQRGGRGGRRFLVASLAAYALALLSKPTTVPLPICFLLLDRWPLRRSARSAWKEKIPFFALGAISAAITILSHGRTAFVRLPTALSPLEVVLLAEQNVVFYLRKILWPAGLSSCYPTPSPSSLVQPAALAGSFLFLALIAVLILARRRSRAPLIGFLFFLVAILPTLGFVRYSWVNVSDKYAYLPAIGILLPFTALLGRIWGDGPAIRWRRRRRAGTIAAFLILATLATIGTRRQIGVWRDTGTLCRSMLATAPDEPALLQHYGWYLAGRAQWDEAETAFRHAMRVAPLWPDPQMGLGVALIQTGRLNDAVRLYEELLLRHPDIYQARTNLAGALLRQGRSGEAVDQCRQAVRAAPQFTPAWVRLTDALLAAHRADEALAAGRQGLLLHPDDPDLHNSVGAVFAAEGKLDEAAAEFRSALRARPDHIQARHNLGWVLESQGHLEDAIREYEAVLRIDPGNGPARARLEAARRKQGN